MIERDDLGLFEGFGIEIEYMLVQHDSLNVCPSADKALSSMAVVGASEFIHDKVSWSNELVNHVIELKTTGPRATLHGLHKEFHEQVQAVRNAVVHAGADLLPGPMHPWFDPTQGIELFPHGQHEIYEAFDRIFGCKHHGFSNLQSMHINLPFQGDDEFGRLHAAVRVALPLLPGLAAGSPFIEGRLANHADERLAVYATNCARIPSVTGQIIPEPVYTIGCYQDLLSTLYTDIAPHDPGKVLQEEWLNARGAIARFDRNCIEIRVIDAQESPLADLGIAELVIALVRALCEERWCSLRELQAFDTALLAKGLWAAIRDAEDAEISDSNWRRALGLRGSDARLGHIWASVAEKLADDLSADGQRAVEHILRHGTLATRLKTAVALPPGQSQPGIPRLRAVYAQCAQALADNRMFVS